MDLAEILYNLQEVPGFAECIARMRNGDIEGTYAELDFGRMLYLRQIRFRYVVPRGRTGSDSDIEVVYPNGLVVCGDAKCKIESTEFSWKTIDYTLEAARSQLPDDRPGIVFVKLPPRWLEIPHFADICVAVASDFLRTTRRVVSVKYYTAQITFVDGALQFQQFAQEISNPITDFGNFHNWNILHMVDSIPPWWKRIILYPDGKAR
jgi:hypothetical protein